MAIPIVLPIVLAAISHTSNMPRCVICWMTSILTDRMIGNHQLRPLNENPNGKNKSTLSRHPEKLNPTNSRLAALAGLPRALGILHNSVVYRIKARSKANRSFLRRSDGFFREYTNPTAKNARMAIASIGVVLLMISLIDAL